MSYWRLIILLFFCVLKVSYAATPDITISERVQLIQKLQQQAKELQLAQHETWLALLHYKRETMLRRFISQADDDSFFLDDNGKTDATAELVANIRAFMREPETKHAQCLFPARWWWLKQQLDLAENYDVFCPKLEVFMKRISHDKLFMVFPTMYLNNPGSTFGHTFLRFDDENGSILLSQTLNYAARVDQSDDFMRYISKGLFGGYTGFFRARQYYETVQEYSNIENRDIWEYQLSFSDEEIKQLVRHVWEVKDIDFDYYFFRENCAYRLLALIDVVRPGMQLTGEGDFPAYAIPVDTVRALDDEGLILHRSFRASLATQIDDYFYAEKNDISDLVLQLISEQTAADKQVFSLQLSAVSSPAKKLEVLNQSYNILQFHGESSSAKALQILQLINELSAQPTSAENVAAYTHTSSPEAGHDSVRIVAGYGEQNSLSYIDLRFRPSFHDLLDDPQGYVNGAAINVFETRFKWFVRNDSSDNLRLESLSLFNVTSFSPLSRWQTPVSWMFDFRFDRAQLSDTQSVRNFISRGGVGFSYRKNGLTPYVLLMGEWQLASAYEKGYSVLLGMQAGLHLTLNANQLMLSYEKDYAVFGFELDKRLSRAQWQYNLQVNHAVRLIYKRTEYAFFNDEDWSVNYNYYF